MARGSLKMIGSVHRIYLTILEHSNLMLPGIAGILYVVSSLSIFNSGIFYPCKLLCCLVGLLYNRKNTLLCSNNN